MNSSRSNSTILPIRSNGTVSNSSKVIIKKNVSTVQGSKISNSTIPVKKESHIGKLRRLAGKVRSHGANSTSWGNKTNSSRSNSSILPGMSRPFLPLKSNGTVLNFSRLNSTNHSIIKNSSVVQSINASLPVKKPGK
jgi:hypothetical protein